MGPANEKVSKQEALEEWGDVEDPLEEVGLQMDPAKRPPDTSEPYYRPLCLFFSVLKWVVPLKICKELTALLIREVPEDSETDARWWSLIGDRMQVLGVLLVGAKVSTEPVLVLRVSPIKGFLSEVLFVRDGTLGIVSLSHELAIQMLLVKYCSLKTVLLSHELAVQILLVRYSSLKTVLLAHELTILIPQKKQPSSDKQRDKSKSPWKNISFLFSYQSVLLLLYELILPETIRQRATTVLKSSSWVSLVKILKPSLSFWIPMRKKKRKASRRRKE